LNFLFMSSAAQKCGSRQLALSAVGLLKN